MDQDLFDLWFTHHFLRYASGERPLLLILDGHSSHYCPDTIKRAFEDVIVFTLPPNTTHLTQPLDKGVFGPMKAAWRDMSFLLGKNPGRKMTKCDFSRLSSYVLVNVAIAYIIYTIIPINSYQFYKARVGRTRERICTIH
jgi:hypothetical protein